MKRLFLFFVLTFTFFIAACDHSKGSGRALINPSNDPSKNPASTVDTQYQIGPLWDRWVVTQDSLNTVNSPALDLLALVTARYRGASGDGTFVYMGKFNGHHLAITNSHVIHKEDDCKPIPFAGPHPSYMSVEFNKTLYSQDQNIQCVNVLAYWTEVDFAIVEIRDQVTDSILDKMPKVVLNNTYPLNKGLSLATVGFGIHLNPVSNYPKALIGGDCKVFSEDNELRVRHDIAGPEDPFELNVWSFVIGCEASGGDSGSALVDLQVPGRIYGLIWGTEANKVPDVLNQNFLDALYDRNDPIMWNQLTYGTSSAKIIEVVGAWLAASDPTNDQVRTIKEFLNYQIQNQR